MTILAWLLAIATTLPLLVLCVECAAGLHTPRRLTVPSTAPPFTVLMPAHDEATGIVAAIVAVRQQLRPGDRLLVVADNCTDATADVALAAGASVCVRSDPARMGKAYALAFGRDVLRARPPSVVTVLDADCVPEPGALLALAATACRTQAAVQGEYLLTVAADAHPLVRVSAFAFLVKNRLRQRGLQRLGAPALLQGTGMAMPWDLFDTAPLVTASLVEDLKLGLDLVLAGHAVQFAPSAGFRSPASGYAATTTQRTRWEQGTLVTTARYIPRLIAAGLTRRPALLLLAGDLVVPPLAMLMAVAVVATAALTILVLAGGTALPLAMVVAALLSVAAILTLIWIRAGRNILPGAAIPTIARYILWKLPIYRGLIAGRQRRWVRTSRVP